MSSSDYEVLNNYLVPFKAKYCCKKFAFQQDNASIHNNLTIKSWFNSQKINVPWWPARNPDLNPVENIWGIIIQSIYADKKQYNSIAELKLAILEAWENFERTF